MPTTASELGRALARLPRRQRQLTCARCGKPTTATTRRRRYCSQTCADRDRRARLKATTA